MTEQRRSGGGRHRWLTITAVLLGCLGLVGVAVFREAPASQAVEFIPVGHWVYHVADESAYHVDGSTGQVDARVPVPGVASDAQVAQGNGSGYVVERERITIFDESTLRVEDAVDPPATERPVVLEVAGGPYLVYRNSGQVVRLGDPTATISAGGPLTDPVATRDGTVWLHRIDTGSLCTLPRGATRLSCPLRMEQRHQGTLTVVGDRAALVDTTADTLSLIHDDGFGPTRQLGFDVPATARVAASDANGRLAVLDVEHASMRLVDTGGLDGRPESAPVEVKLSPERDYLGPVAAANVVAVVDTTTNELLTYDNTGERRETMKLPAEDGSPRLVPGEDDRIYVDSPDGSRVLVVDGSDGSVLDVPVVVADPDAESDPDVDNNTEDTGDTGPGQGTDAAGSGSDAGDAQERRNPPTGQPADERRSDDQDDAPPARSEPGPPADEDTTPPVAPATPPGAPGAVTAVAGHQSATVRWRPAADNGAPVTAYHLSWPGGSTRVAGSATQATVSGLTNGTAYSIAVAAENSAGRGPAASAAAVIPSRPADAPVITVPPRFGAPQPVTWTEPNLYGGTLVHYLVSLTGEADQTTTQPSILPGFSLDPRTITVRAVTRFGPAGAPTVTGEPGSAEIAFPVDFPSASIQDVAWTSADGDELAVTFTVRSQSSATCVVSVTGGPSTEDACADQNTFTVAGVARDALGTVQVAVTVTNAAGNTSPPASWIGTPAAPSGGFVLWLGPGALAAAHWWTTRRNNRRGQREDSVS